MPFLGAEREVLDHYLPGMDGKLLDAGMSALERRGNAGPSLLKAAGGAGLLVPREHGGAGAGLPDALHVQRAIGSRSPSLAVASTMHHFSVAGLVQACMGGSNHGWLILQAVAEQNLLVASGFAEGRPGGSIMSPNLQARPTDDGGVIIDGHKKPCSLATSMDLLTASVMVTDGDATEQLAIALVPATDPGLTVSPYWNSFVLAGAESDQVTLKDIRVPGDLIVPTRRDSSGALDALQTAGFVWFELLISASYLGAASALAERALAHPRTGPAAAAVAGQLDSAMSTLEGVARSFESGLNGEPALVAALNARYAVQDVLHDAVPRAAELLGGGSYMSADDVPYLVAACLALRFHPPARTHMAGPLRDWYDGVAPLRIA